MLALIDIGPLHWAGFITAVLVLLALDLGVFHRHAHVVKFREALGWTAFWFTLALFFAFLIAPHLVGQWGRTETVEFITGYITELSLSMDNVFVIALIFNYFRVPLAFQHRVLFWGILGALVMRGVMIFLGAQAVAEFHWILYFLGAFLVYSGVKMIFAGEESPEPEKNPAIRLARRLYPIAPDFVGQKFVVVNAGRRMLTPLALVLVMVETTDLIFAVDSIPAIFGITTNSFIIFTSNVFAILGLRSLYFVLAGAIGYFRYLKVGLSLVLVFIGLKMLLPLVQAKLGLFPGWKMTSTHALVVVAGIILVSVLASLIAARREPPPPH
jgi:tellurite resistance protein TerC